MAWGRQFLFTPFSPGGQPPFPRESPFFALTMDRRQVWTQTNPHLMARRIGLGLHPLRNRHVQKMTQPCIAPLFLRRSRRNWHDGRYAARERLRCSRRLGEDFARSSAAMGDSLGARSRDPRMFWDPRFAENNIRGRGPRGPGYGTTVFAVFE